jgi:uncharacterized protein (TIGR00725 family)
MQIGVIGPGDCSPEEYAAARKIGRLLALSGATLCCGGLSGVMERHATVQRKKEAGLSGYSRIPGRGTGTWTW